MTKEYILTLKDEELLLKLYYQNVKFEQMYQITQIPKRKIRKYFKDINLNLVKRYEINDKFFDNIDTANKAYWLGYLYCDGFVGSGKYNNIVLSSIDKNVIDEFIENICVNGKDFIYNIDEKRVSSYGDKPLHECRFSNKHIKEKLCNYNIFPNRKEIAFLKYENINNIQFLYHILYGMIDADGSVYYDKNKSLKSISLYCGHNLIHEYVNFFKLLNLKFTTRKHNYKNVYYTHFSLSDNNTKLIMQNYLSFSKIKRKSCPSI